MFLGLIILLFCCATCVSQTDSLVMNNENVLIGEVKDMDKGVLTMETDYSDSDFKIEWDGIQYIFTTTYFMITLSSGDRYAGSIESTGDGHVRINDLDGDSIEVKMDDIVYLKSVEKTFWSRLYVSLSFGFSVTKANDFRQLTSRTQMGYVAERWMADAVYDGLFTTQEDVEATERTDIAFTFRYFLPKDWYPLAQLTFLSNTEQQLKLRTNGKLGIGKYVVHSNRTYWGFSGGVAFNNEVFDVTSEETGGNDQQSMEAFFGTELNLFDIGDLSFLMYANAYPSITEEGRWRGDGKADFKYDFPKDIYLKMGVSVNYDNRPVEGASETDYIYQTTIGWEL